MEYAITILTWIFLGLLVVGVPMILIRLWMNSIRMRKRAVWLADQTWQLLSIQVPKENEKSPLAAEQMFAALHGILRSDPVVQEYLSFEIVAHKESIHFYIFVPLHLRDFLEGQIYAQYPEVVIKEVTDYTAEVDKLNMPISSVELGLTKEDFYPIKTFTDFEVDPMAGITSVLTKLDEKEEIWFQICIKPVPDSWQQRGVDFVKQTREGKTGVSFSVASGFGHLLGFLADVVVHAFDPSNLVPGIQKTDAKPPELSGPVREALEGIEKKVIKLGFETLIRIVAVGKDEISAKTRVQSMVATFKQFNTTNKNGFKANGEIKLDNKEQLADFRARNIEKKGYIFNIEELASIFHFPNQSVETPGLSWSGPKKGEAPANLPLKESVSPKELTVVGQTDFRNIKKEFGIKIDDRRRHIYIVGKSGVGKTTLMENMIIDDVYEDRGVIVVDPHGELADKIISSVPRRRMDDVIVFDPADRNFPIAFNLLENVDEDFKGMVASGFVGIFKKIFGFSWGPRLEHILRNTVLALLDVPNSTMMGIPKMLTEAKYREDVLEYVKDPVIQDFWINEFAAMDQKFRTEAVSPVLNKVGQFLSTPTIRNIVGQPKSNLDIREIMDNEKILVVNLSRGKIGEDNTALLGAMMITKVQLAAMSRADVPESKRPDCFLYVDEFQNFATESFATILSEARKYHLGLTMANQYIAQMPEEVRDAVFGNVGTIVSFRVGATDADFLVKEFEPVFDQNDLVNLEKFHIYIKLLVDGIAASAFSAQTLSPRLIEENLFDEMVEHSRRCYAQDRSVVESQIEKLTGIKERLDAQRAAKEVTKKLENAAQKFQALPVIKQFAPSPQPNSSDGGVVTGSIERERKELKVIGEYIYKQHDQKGGKNWYLPEKLEDEYKKEEEKQKKKAEKRQLKESSLSTSVGQESTSEDVS